MSEEDRIRNLMMLDYSQLIMYTANLEELNDINRKEIERLNSIIDKAIEYIKGNESYCMEISDYIIEILKGEDKE